MAKSEFVLVLVDNDLSVYVCGIYDDIEAAKLAAEYDYQQVCLTLGISPEPFVWKSLHDNGEVVSLMASGHAGEWYEIQRPTPRIILRPPTRATAQEVQS